MASCERYEEVLWEAAETGVIPTELQRHLDACPTCREGLASLQGAMTGFAKLRQLPDHVPAVMLAPLLPAGRWWPRIAFACLIVALAIAAVSVCLLARKKPVSVTDQRPAPSVQPRQPEPEPIIVKEAKKMMEPCLTQPAPTPTRHRHVAKKSRLPAPIAIQQEQPASEPLSLPVPEYLIEALISAQPVNNITAVSDLPLAYTITPVDPAALKDLGIDPAPPQAGVTTAVELSVCLESSCGQAMLG